MEQQVAQQTNYQPQYASNVETAPVMTIKDWVITSIIMVIPLVNIIMLFVWAFGGGVNPNKANWAKAGLLVAAVGIGLYIIFGVIIFGLLASTM